MNPSATAVRSPAPRAEPRGTAPAASPCAVVGRLVRREVRLAVALSRWAEREGEAPLVAEPDAAAHPLPPAYAGQRARTLADDARRLAADVAEVAPGSSLARQVGALEAVAATLAGERRPFDALVRAVAGAPLVAPSAERLARRAELFALALPGRGHVVERLDAWRRRTALPPTRLPLLHELVAVTVAELRRRAAARWPLPDGEGVEVAFGRRGGEDAHATWLGGGLSRLDVAVDRGWTVCDLPRLLARETYPGRHLVAATLGVRPRGASADRAVDVALTPRAALREGYATWAFDAVFPPEEAAAFAREELLPRAGVPTADVDLDAWFAAAAVVDTSELEAEAARRLATGASEQAAGTYLAMASLLPPSVAAARIPTMRSVLRRLAPCVRAAGREVLRPFAVRGGAEGLASVLAAGLDVEAGGPGATPPS